MKDVPCLCDRRNDIRCDPTHCDLAGPGQAGNPNECRVCWLRLKKVSSETKGSEENHRTSPLASGSARLTRILPCLYLGEVLDKQGCACPARWLRACAIHKVCNLQQCKICPDYEET